MKNHEWLLRNSLRSFPVREGQKVVSVNSGWTLNPAILVDASIFSDLSGDPIFCLQSVNITRSICSIVIGDSVSGQSLGCASFISGLDKPFLQKKITPLIDGFSGFVSFGPALLDDERNKLMVGYHNFGGEAILETRCGISLGEFPVRSLRAHGLSGIRDRVQINAEGDIAVSFSTGSHDGDQIELISISLKNPSGFLSPCETRITPCDCDATPIKTINGIEGDEDGKITIEIEDDNGNIYLLSQSVLAFSIIRSGVSLCSRPAVPDEYGRLPGVSGNYADDLPPVSDYKNPADESFPIPII